MAMNFQDNKNEIMERINRIEKGITDSSNYRRDAMTQISIYGKQLEENTEELIKLGTSPETIDQDIARLEKEILELIEKAESYIPFEELKKREERLKGETAPKV